MPEVRWFPREENRSLKRIYALALLALPPVVAVSAFWGPDHAASAFTGGALILLCGLWTHAGIKGLFSPNPKKMRRRIWWRVVWRYLLLGLALYAILQAPWLRLGSFIAGLSLFVPAILVESIIGIFSPES
jgi:hypothetical protein